MDRAAAAFAALGSEPRLAILRALVRAGTSGLAVGVLQNRTGLAASTLSHHIKALAMAGVISQVRDGRSLMCSARFDRIEALADFLLHECCAEPPGDVVASPVGGELQKELAK